MRAVRASCARLTLAGLVIALVLTPAIAGCDQDGGQASQEAAEQKAVARALLGLQRAFKAGDRAEVCARMSPIARRQAGLVAHGQPDSCVQDLTEALKVIDSGGGLRASPFGPVAVAAEGRRATATLALDGHGAVGVPLERTGKGWGLATFFGTSPLEALDAAAASRRAPYPSARGAVTVGEAPNVPCLPLFAEDYPLIVGGCELSALAPRIRLTIGTAFGHFEFGECELKYRVMVDESGRAWTNAVEFNGAGNINNGCADVQPCELEKGLALPWRGRVSATPAGRFVHRMNVCLDTCIGFYAGTLSMTLERGERGWRAVATNEGVGNSGLRLDGTVDLDTYGLHIAEQPSRTG